MSGYACGTEVSVDQSQGEIKRVLLRHGADKITFGEWAAEGIALVQFEYKTWACQVRVHLPKIQEKRFQLTKARQWKRTPDQTLALWHAECRRKWRVLLLLIKAKFEAIEEGVVSPDEALLSWLLLPSGSTVGDAAKGNIDKLMSGANAGQLLLGMKEE